MKHNNPFSWKRLWRSSLALLLIMSLLLCGCANVGEDDGEGSKPAGNNVLFGDGDGRLEAKDAVDSVTNIYGALLGALGGNQKPDTSVEMDLVLTLGDALKVQLGNALGQMDMDSGMSWLKNIGLHMQTGYADDMMQMVVDAQINGKDVITAEVVMDLLGGMVYLSAPDLNSQALGTEVDMSQLQGMGASSSQLLAEYAELLKDLPSDKDLNAVLSRYLELAIDTLDAPVTSSKELSHGGITQKVTTTTYSITNYNVLDVAQKILTTAKTDADLEKVMDAFSKVVNDIGAKEAAEQGSVWTDVDLYQQMLEAIDPALEDIAETKADLVEEEFLVLEVYGDGKTQQGFNVIVNGMEYMKLYSLNSGNDTAFYLGVSGGMLQITGNGTAKGSKVSGNYDIRMHGIDLLYVELEDFDTKALSKGELKGTLRLQLAETLLDEMGNNMFLNEDTIIELVLDIGGKTAEMEVNLYADQILLFGISLTTKTGSAGKIKAPANYVNMQDSYAMEQWAQDIKFSGVLSNLRSAGVPDELVDLLQQALEESMSGGGGQAYPDFGY